MAAARESKQAKRNAMHELQQEIDVLNRKVREIDSLSDSKAYRLSQRGKDKEKGMDR